MRYSTISAAPFILTLLLTGCGAVGGVQKPAVSLDKAAVGRVANIVKQGGDYGAAYDS
jgi:hypothetical protein